jgi:signal transduction histidine kinase
VFWAAGIGLVVVFGRLIHRQRRLTAQLQAAQAKLLEHAIQAEQRRIAREIHDLVAHLLSVTMLHVTAARLALTTEPDEAAASLADAERLGRHSLVELRRTVGLLRGAETSLAPLPSAAEIGELVERFRSAGMLVRLDVSGDPATLAPSTGLGLYRVVQESLSNVARHAPDATVSVAVNAGAAGASATVYSEPAGPAGESAHGGLGVLGMRERAELLGGTLAAGPAGTGWLVECRIPAAGAGTGPVLS